MVGVERAVGWRELWVENIVGSGERCGGKYGGTKGRFGAERGGGVRRSARGCRWRSMSRRK